MKTLKTYEMELRCKLTEQELKDRSDALAKEYQRCAEEEDEKRRDAARRKERIDEIKGHMSQLSREIRERSVYRPVIVEETPDYRGDYVEVIRTDTGEVIKTRKFTEEERQLGMFPGPEARAQLGALKDTAESSRRRTKSRATAESADTEEVEA